MSASDSGAQKRSDSMHPSAPDDTYETWVGRVIDARYRIDGLLGEGGMGAVFEAQHLKLKKAVALKVIHPEFAGDGEVAKRFVREAMASAQLEHPHVASATDYGTLDEGGAYLVMPLVRGGSLRDALDAKGALGWERACEIAAQIADALSSAHKASIVHRDLKPDNVMLEPRDDGSDRVLVLDFGIARVADEKLAASGQALTRVGTVIGTPGYMAPEQALGEPVDFRVDIYALGLLLYEMVSGEQLFDTDDLTAIVTRQLTEDPPRLSELGHEIPEELDELVFAALKKDREARPQSAADVRELLSKLVLSAQLERVRSGMHSLPEVAPEQLAPTDPAATDPAPDRTLETAGRTDEDAERTDEDPRPPAAVARDTSPKDAVAPTMMAKPAPTPSPVGRGGLPAPVAELAAKLRAQPPKVLAGLAAGAGLLVLLLLGWGVSALFGDDEGLTKQEMVRAVVDTPDEEVEEEDDEPGIIDAITDRRRPIPPALAQQHADLMLSDRARARRRAAREILAHEPRDEVPEFLIAVAEIENTRRCNQRREHVVRLGELGDTRALPALERLDATPRNRCGNFIQRRDCLGCLRDELATALSELRPE